MAIKAPGFGDDKKATLQDIAIVTGGTVVSGELGLKLEPVSHEQLGSCEKVTVSKDETVVVGGFGKKEAVDGRADEIRRQIETSDSNYEKEKMREGFAKLTSGIAVINVGAASEVLSIVHWETGMISSLYVMLLFITRRICRRPAFAGGPGALFALLRSQEKSIRYVITNTT